MIKHKRVKTEAMIDTVQQLAQRIWKQHYIPIIGEEQVAYMLKHFQSAEVIKEQIEEKGYEYYLLFNEEDPIGYIGIKIEGERLFLSKFYIDEQFRGKGIGSSTFSWIDNYARERNCKKIWLTVNRYNEKSISIYLSKGFKSVRKEKTNIGNDFVMDDYIMEKSL